MQWRVLRDQHLAAARDGRQVKASLERALSLDPDLHDAKYGIGLYRYYADIAPAALRLLRWLLLLPGGHREDGLRQIEEARLQGLLVRGEADYQLHLIYLWYEKRSRDALALIRGLQARYPHNPLFYQAEADIHDVYFHDPAASLAVSADALRRATEGTVHEPALTMVRARFNIAVQLDRLGRRREAIDALDRLIEERPSRPFGITDRARRERTRLPSYYRALHARRRRDRRLSPALAIVGGIAHLRPHYSDARAEPTSSDNERALVVSVGEKRGDARCDPTRVDVRGRFALTTRRRSAGGF